jgi:hypothetical protein
LVRAKVAREFTRKASLACAQLSTQVTYNIHVNIHVGCEPSHCEFELYVAFFSSRPISSIGLSSIPDLWRGVEMLARGKNNSNEDIAVNI